MPWAALLLLWATSAMADPLTEAEAAFRALDSYRATVRSVAADGERQAMRYFYRKPGWVRIEMLSRFRTKGEQRKIIQLLREGGVDIVIGTHRLVQPDVHFKDLGLVVIDEEQRFGVLHKERFKQLRRMVDVLTLSATPIPRTLYLSLTGARDMSTIETAPSSTQSDVRAVVPTIRSSNGNASARCCCMSRA